MKRRKIAAAVLLLISLFSLIACGKQNESSSEDKEIHFEKEAGDFVLRFISEKKVYSPHEELKISVQVKYIGSEEKKVIEHGGFSPVKFTVEEKSKGITIEPVEPMILMQTILDREQWYTFPFEKSGEGLEGKFYEDYFTKEGLPKGEYSIQAVFSFQTNENEKYPDMQNGNTLIEIGNMEIHVK